MGAQRFVISPVTRIEGHFQVQVDLDDNGNVTDTMVQSKSLRGFEGFCVGRPVEEMPRITTSICGVCPTSHHVASVKANDMVFGVEPTATGRKLRELMLACHYFKEHLTHFYILAGADLLMGEVSPVAERSIFGLLKKLPHETGMVIKARWLAAEMAEIVGGRSIHPVAGVPGGWSKPLRTDQLEKCKGYSKLMLDVAKVTISYAKENIFPGLMDDLKTLGAIDTSFLGTVGDRGTFEPYDGNLRMMGADGEHREFTVTDYVDNIKEHVEPWSYMKFPYDAKAGGFSMDLERPQGIYRTGALARINVVENMRSPLAQAELEEFRKAFGRPAQPTMLYHWARLIELLDRAEYIGLLLEDPDISSTDTRAKVEAPKAGRGTGHVESPRGTLFHDYEVDDKGLVTSVNIITGTTQNNAALNMAVRRAATGLTKGTINRLQMVIRAFDPCVSCGTH